MSWWSRSRDTMLLVLPVLGFLSILYGFWVVRDDSEPRAAFLWAAVSWGVILLVVTEVLSLFGRLTVGPLALSWCGVALGAALVAPRLTRGQRFTGLKLERPSLLTLALSLPIIAVVLVTGVLATVSWPNSPGAMLYHLSRVAHWIQNHSIAFYPTNISRQLFFQPWAEYAMLHLALLGGSDRFAQLVQWFSMLGSVIGVSLIARRLGGGVRAQLLSAVFCVTLPMGILQASSTQNSYATAFWLVCTAYALLAMRSGRTPHLSAFGAGASLGLALSTKGTAYTFVAPFLVVFLFTRRACLSVESIKQILLIAATALALVGPQYYRNYEQFGSVLGPVRQQVSGPSDLSFGLTNDAFTPAIFTSNVLRNAALHLGTPFPAVNSALEGLIKEWHVWLGLGIVDRRSTWVEPDTRFDISSPDPIENQVGNLVHLPLIALTALAVVGFRRPPRATLLWQYGLCVLLGFALFCLMYKWQPIHSRLHLPLFVLWSPVVGLVLQANARLVALTALLMSLWAWPFLVTSRSHPLLGEANVLNMSRSEQYFLNHDNLQLSYGGASRFVRQQGCEDVGLLLAWNDWEYPFWAILGQRDRDAVRIEHVNVRNHSARLTTRWPPFSPCAVIAVRGPEQDTLEVAGGVYRRAWSSTERWSERAVRKVEVFTRDAERNAAAGA